MSNSSGRYSDKLCSVSVDHGSVVRLGSRLLAAGKRNPMKRRPLLDLLLEVLDGDQVVDGTVPGLESGVSTVVARVHSLDLVGPLLSRLDDLSVRAFTIRADGAGSRRSGHTSGGNARVACGSSDSVRVCRGKNIGHHASGAAASDKDLVAVGLPRIDSIINHADKDLAVTLATVFESLCAGDIPTVRVLLRRGIDQDNLARVGQRSVFTSLLEIALSTATTRVQGKHHCWVSGEVARDIGLHDKASVVSWSKVVDSLELSRNQAGTQGELSEQLARGQKVKHGGYSVSCCLVVESVVVVVFFERD
jgi:hypothetical protein